MGTRFRRVNSEDGSRTRFRVFLIHGRSTEWEKVKGFIEGKLRFEVIVSAEEFTGQPLIEKIRGQVWHDCDCAVAILSADDLQRDRTRNPRPNVLFELGYCMGFFDMRYWDDEGIRPVILVADNRTRIPSDLEGIERIPYSYAKGQGISETLETLGQALNGIYAKVDEYFS